MIYEPLSYSLLRIRMIPSFDFSVPRNVILDPPILLPEQCMLNKELSEVCQWLRWDRRYVRSALESRPECMWLLMSGRPSLAPLSLSPSSCCAEINFIHCVTIKFICVHFYVIKFRNVLVISIAFAPF